MEENTTIAENTQPSVTNYSLNFHGKGGEYFSIVIVNWLLTVITIGLYYPWAKARQLQYLYGATELEGDRFTFHGTGKEMFKGFIKAILIFAIIYGGFFALAAAEMPILAVVYLYAGLIALIPLAMKGVTYKPLGASKILQRNLLIYGVGGIIVPFIGIKIIDVLLVALGLA